MTGKVQVAFYSMGARAPDMVRYVGVVPRIGETVRLGSSAPIFPVINVLHRPGENVELHVYLGDAYRPRATRPGVEDGTTVGRAADEVRSADAQERGWAVNDEGGPFRKPPPAHDD